MVGPLFLCLQWRCFLCLQNVFCFCFSFKAHLKVYNDVRISVISVIPPSRVCLCVCERETETDRPFNRPRILKKGIQTFDIGTLCYLPSTYLRTIQSSIKLPRPTITRLKFSFHNIVGLLFCIGLYWMSVLQCSWPLGHRLDTPDIFRKFIIQVCLELILNILV